MPSELSTFVATLTTQKFQSTDKTFPVLKGRAYQCRGLTEPLLNLWVDRMSGSRQDRLLKMVMQRSVDFDRIIRNYAMASVLPADVSWTRF